MDSLTQIVLGATVAYSVIGKEAGRKAALYGAVLGTLPDLDVLIDFGGEVENFTYHRSFSHSLLVQAIITPLLAWCISKIPTTNKKIPFLRCCIAVFLCLSTHALLDTCTVYGTQLFWPLTELPFSLSNVFIIDPIYTLPLLVASIVTLCSKNRARAMRFTHFGLIFSSGYILWSLVAKYTIDHKIRQVLEAQAITSHRYLSTPAPFNTLLWRAVAVVDDGYYEIYASIFDTADEVSIEKYPSSPQLLANIQDNWQVKRLTWFTRGLYAVKQQDTKIILSDLRMGLEGAYVFNFEVGQLNNNIVSPGSFKKVGERPQLKETTLVFQRVWNSSVSLAPAARQALFDAK